jgi:3-oxoacyl-[acyl-carrier protein] reductase
MRDNEGERHVSNFFDSKGMFSDMRVGVSGVNGGIGQAVLSLFTAQGADVIGFARHPGPGQNLLDMRMDEQEMARRIRDASTEDYDVWMNLAGADVLSPITRTLPYMTRLQKLWEVDVAGAIKCCRAVLPLVRNHGIIVNVAWDEALTGASGDSASLYGTAKAAIIGYSASLAKSLVGVRIYVLSPGWVATRWAHSLNEEQQTRLIRRSAGKRWIDPAEVADAAWQLIQERPPSGFIMQVK